MKYFHPVNSKICRTDWMEARVQKRKKGKDRALHTFYINTGNVYWMAYWSGFTLPYKSLKTVPKIHVLTSSFVLLRKMSGREKEHRAFQTASISLNTYITPTLPSKFVRGLNFPFINPTSMYFIELSSMKALMIKGVKHPTASFSVSRQSIKPENAIKHKN